mmetsp:Transcript_4861/g.10221  ORF Transcript_4861/g.10221 Transcript_4861/m.10221 type:complete len:84 (-) Transcript_4861:560-811(-)
MCLYKNNCENSGFSGAQKWLKEQFRFFIVMNISICGEVLGFPVQYVPKWDRILHCPLLLFHHIISLPPRVPVTSFTKSRAGWW